MSSMRSSSLLRSRRRQAASVESKVSLGVESQVRWKLDGQGHITNFNMKVLRKDILQRLHGGTLYTLEECRAFLLELMRVATAWQEEEFPCIMYLSDLHDRLLPGASLSFQWPPSNSDNLPHADMPREEGALPMIAVAVEEINRAVVRMIDRLWESRRERLLFAARLLEDIEPLLKEVSGSASSV